jgi:hypothetical protein
MSSSIRLTTNHTENCRQKSFAVSNLSPEIEFLALFRQLPDFDKGKLIGIAKEYLNRFQRGLSND